MNAKEYGVVALTGEWGVGKTELWKSLAKEEKIAHAYVSLFGVKNAADLKRRLASSRVKLDESEGEQLRRSWKSLSAALANALEKYADANGVVGATANVINDLAGDRVVERILTDSVVVLDDLERADPSLNMEEILGIVDDLRRMNCQVLIILNDKHLAEKNKAAWQGFHEKVVDLQLALQITPADAIDAVLNTAVPQRQKLIRDAWLQTSCRNIRIAQRVLRADRSIFRDRDTTKIRNLVADAVFLTIAEARGFHRDADAVEVLSIMTGVHSNQQTEAQLRRDAIRKSAPVNFSVYRNFQDVAIAFLKTGYLNEETCDAAIDEAIAEIDAGGIRQQLQEWVEAAIWDPTLSDEEARRRAENFLPDVWQLPPRNAQEFIYALRQIGELDLIERFIDAWRQGTHDHLRLYSKNLTIEPPEPIDPRIFQAIDDLEPIVRPRPPLLDALRRNVSGQDYRDNDVAAINAATAEEWEVFVAASESKEAFDLIYKLFRHGGNDTSQGRLSLRTALQHICETQPGTKLSRVILRSGLLPPIPPADAEDQG